MELTIQAIDVHCEGEPGRVLLASHLYVKGATMAERLEYARANLEWLRRLLLREPRGYPALCAALVLPPTRPEADFGLIIMNQSGFSPMSGSNTMCAITALLQTQAIPRTEPVTSVVIDTAVGLVRAEARIEAGRVSQVTVHSVPAFVAEIGSYLDVPELGRVQVDVAFGGQFVVQADAQALGVSLEPGNAREITRVGALIKMAAQKQIAVEHPLNPAINYIGLAMLHGPAVSSAASGRNAVVITKGNPEPGRPDTWTGTLDRSPCGNGTCARMAVLHARGELAIGQQFVSESILGTTFTGQLHERGHLGTLPTVLPSIAGRSWITARSDFLLDEHDPFPEGFTVADLWGDS